MKGKHRSESKKRCSDSVKESHKRKEYGFIKGHTPWNKNMKGMKDWYNIKGLELGRGWMKNKHHTNKTRAILKIKNSGWKHTSESRTKIKTNTIVALSTPEMRRRLRENRALQILPVKDTTIEVKIQDYLKQLGITFLTHQYMHIDHAYHCDILIPSMNLVIECDGDYWHKYPIGDKIDHVRTSELIQKGFKVLRLWEKEIRKMSVNDLKNRLGALVC